MAKPIEIDGVLYRRRRGKLVKIPEKWVGRTVSNQKKNKRNSKTRNKAITGKSVRAQAKDAMGHGEEPNPNARKTLKSTFHGCYRSGRTDKHRNRKTMKLHPGEERVVHRSVCSPTDSQKDEELTFLETKAVTTTAYLKTPVAEAARS